MERVRDSALSVHGEHHQVPRGQRHPQLLHPRIGQEEQTGRHHRNLQSAANWGSHGTPRFGEGGQLEGVTTEWQREMGASGLFRNGGGMVQECERKFRIYH